MLEAAEVGVEYANDAWLETDELAVDDRISEGYQAVTDAFEALREAIDALEALVEEAAAA